MTEEPASLILEPLRQMRAELATKDDLESVRAEVSGVRSEVADVKSDMHSLRADVAADLLTTRKELGEQIVGLRRAVIDYHTSVIGHGVITASSRRVSAGSSSISTFPPSTRLRRGSAP
jgi:hypothetical protein